MRRHTSTLVVLVVTAVLVMGTRGSFGLFIGPWEELFDSGRASVSLISAIGFLVYGFGQPTAGRLLERWPTRYVIGLGLGLMALGLGGAAMSTAMWMAILSIGVVASFGTGLASLSALSYVAGELVESKGGLIFGLLTAGAAGGQVIVLPIATAALNVSLRASLLTLAALAVAGAVVVLIKVPPLPTREATIGTTPISTMFRERRFWLLLIPFFICGYTTTGMIETHLIPFALDHHVAQTAASAALATLAAFNVAGVLIAGVLTDRIDRGKMLGWIYLMRAATLLILPFVTNATGLFVFGALFGVADFSTVPPTTSLTQTVFRTGGWAVAIGIISAAHQIGSAMGAWVPGVILETTGSYSMAFVSGSIALLVAGYLSFLLRESTQVTKPVSV
ncbi:MAG: MFS transporter [Acidimicrobiia bacterium]|nr:MFS transporter [Acidimicrobiia bacterium]